jgi:hypothetical protein
MSNRIQYLVTLGMALGVFCFLASGGWVLVKNLKQIMFPAFRLLF